MLRYLRNKDLINQSLLDEVTIIGAGGIASALVTILAQMGFKKFHIWDDDKLEEHNLSTTAYPEGALGWTKVKCAASNIMIFNKGAKTYLHNQRWEPGDYLSDIVLLTPDNMETRLDVHMDWKKKENRKALIDMRMGALTMEVISVDKDNDIFVKTWKPSNKISDEACTAKHTIFTANVVAGLGASQLFNVLHNRSYWQYIRQSLAPLSFGREYPVNKITEVKDNGVEKVKTKPVSINPGIMLLYGPPKVGKTTMLSKLDNCLIIDTESGSSMIEGYIHKVNSRAELINLVKEAKDGHDYKYFAIDTIDKVVDWAEKAVCQEYEVPSIADLSFGKGYALVREKVMGTIHNLKNCVDHLIVIGHRKVARAIVDGKAIVEPESLDITGKLKNMIMSDCDAIGYVHREEDKLMISFKANEAIEAGSRCEHLKGQIIEFDWKNIYKKEK